MNGPFVALVHSELSDAYYIHSLFAQEDIAAAFPDLKFTTLEEVESYLSRQINREFLSCFFQSVRLTYHEGDTHDDSNSLFAGVVFVYLTESKHVEGTFPCFGFAMSAAHRNLGLMHLALTNILDGMIEAKYTCIFTLVHPNNEVGIALLDKTGFVKLEESKKELLYVKRLTMGEEEFNQTFALT